jgi:DNA-binding beta-propeller fold protein YncE
MTTIVLLLVRGYSFDLKDGIHKTGLIVLDSNPKNAYITVNNHVQPEKTRATLKLPPGEYDVKVDLPSVYPWEKQIKLDPASAELEEHILLFRKNTDPKTLTKTAPIAQSLSASGNEYAFLTANGNDVTLSLTKIKPDSIESPRQIATLPASYAAPRTFDWSADGSRVIASAGSETRIIKPEGETVTIPVAGRAASAPGQTDAAIIEPQPGSLVRATATTTEPYESDVTAWTPAGKAIYVARSDGSLARRGNGSERRVISQQPVLTDLSAAAEDTEKVFGRDAGGTLYQVTDKGLERLANDVERYAVSRDGNQVAYLTQRELRLWDGLEERDDLLTRFTEAPEQLAVVPGGYYVLYGRSGEVHTIAADGTNDTTLASGVDLTEVINRERILVRDRTSGGSAALTILDR